MSSTETILASLNTHGGRGADGRPYDLEAACRQLKADIIVLQEVWRPRGEPNPVGEIAVALGAKPLWTDLIRDVDLDSVGIADEPARGRWGLATLTTAPVLGFEVTDLGRIPGDLTPRAAQPGSTGPPRPAAGRRRHSDRDRRGPQHADARHRAGGRLCPGGERAHLPG